MSHMEDGPTMPAPGHHRLIDELVAKVDPVRPFTAPFSRVLGWMLYVGLPATSLLMVGDTSDLCARYSAEPILLLSMLGSAATAITAALAAAMTSLPDRGREWALLPLPGLTCWIVASLVQAMPEGPVEAHTAVARAYACFGFILGFGLPFAALLIGLLRRGYPLWPERTAALAGLAAASAAASILGLFHPFAMTAEDCLFHASAVALLSGACAVLVPARMS
ncbi:Protein of unknown function [Methylobacterium sp. 190mf]|nr:Protein of unknown function [Methylobacterium sp. 190mf]